MLSSFILPLKVSKIECQQWLARLGVMPGRGIIKDTVNIVYLLSFCLLNYFWVGRENDTVNLVYLL